MRFRNVQTKTKPSLDNVCYLIDYATEFDDVGNEIQKPSEIMCFCAELPINSSEFFNAGQQGIKSEFCLLLDSESYSNETSVKYNDVIYSVYRVYVRADAMTELYVKLKVGG